MSDTAGAMPTNPPSKYGLALTGSDWVGLPLRVGQVPESGVVEDLSSDTDTILVWSGGKSGVTVHYRDPDARTSKHCQFTRTSGAMDLLPRGTRLHKVIWQGESSTCTSVTLPAACLSALCSEPAAGLDTAKGARFGLTDAHVVDLVHRLRAQAEGEANYGAVYIQSLSLTLASYLCVRYGGAPRGEGPPHRSLLSAAHRQAIEAFIERELASDFGLVDVASLTRCPDHFSRLFKQAFKQSPYQYVLSRRIERAKVMLRGSDLAIAEIAIACGFANQGHLTTVFKRRTGMTPAAYRRT